jgi:hypothetical protein
VDFHRVFKGCDAVTGLKGRGSERAQNVTVGIRTVFVSSTHSSSRHTDSSSDNNYHAADGNRI